MKGDESTMSYFELQGFLFVLWLQLTESAESGIQVTSHSLLPWGGTISSFFFFTRTRWPWNLAGRLSESSILLSSIPHYLRTSIGQLPKNETWNEQNCEEASACNKPMASSTIMNWPDKYHCVSSVELSCKSTSARAFLVETLAK